MGQWPRDFGGHKQLVRFSPGTKMKRNIVFLDIDGVMNRNGLSPKGTGPIEEPQLGFLRRIIGETSAEVVITSQRRIIREQRAEVMRILYAMGQIEIGGFTPIIFQSSRGNEIQVWLLENGQEGKFIILDDNHIGPSGRPHHLDDRLLLCDPYVGLTSEIADKAIKLLLD
jgi:hypothetical protein